MSNVNLGRIAVLLVGIGGSVLFWLFSDVMSNLLSSRGFMPIQADIAFSFLGFIVVGLGLYLIVQTGKPDS